MFAHPCRLFFFLQVPMLKGAIKERGGKPSGAKAALQAQLKALL
jgi:hypothetical protein